MSLKRNVLDAGMLALTAGVRFVLGERRNAVVLAHVAEYLAPVITVDTPLGSLKLHCPGDLPVFRANTLLTKEPETIAWIDTFHSGDVLWDIGANVGMYSLYAGLKPGVQVLAFEPAVVNCQALNRNIEINALDAKISAFCVAFSDSTVLDYLYMAGTRVGEASHTFGEEIDLKGQPFHAQFRQGALGFSVDDLLATCHPAFPNHIKIDVDGIEDKILQGARNTLADPRLRSVLVELDVDRQDYCRHVHHLLGCAGMRLLHRKRAAMFDNTDYASIWNHVFVRG
jgi:FkbM family methyltransferase